MCTGISAALIETDWQEAGEKIAEGLATIDYAGIAASLFYGLGAALASSRRARLWSVPMTL